MSLPKLLLFDTGCILAVMKLNLWPQLCVRFHVVVPSIIVRNEARYVNLVPGNITPIDLTQDVAAGTITEFEATPAELMQVLKDWPSAIRDRADDGEVEALAYLRAHGTSDTAFLTADGPAIQAAIALNCSGEPMSLEELLQLAGCPKHNLEWPFTKQFVAEQRKKAVAHLLARVAPAPTRGRRRRP
jgi:hypothetical protein